MGANQGLVFLLLFLTRYVRVVEFHSNNNNNNNQFVRHTSLSPTPIYVIKRNLKINTLVGGTAARHMVN